MEDGRDESGLKVTENKAALWHVFECLLFSALFVYQEGETRMTDPEKSCTQSSFGIKVEPEGEIT
jgi:hypothetical protein